MCFIVQLCVCHGHNKGYFTLLITYLLSSARIVWWFENSSGPCCREPFVKRPFCQGTFCQGTVLSRDLLSRGRFDGGCYVGAVSSRAIVTGHPEPTKLTWRNYKKIWDCY